MVNMAALDATVNTHGKDGYNEHGKDGGGGGGGGGDE